ncbi:MAG TPA: prolyl oligopeptidase family serine peptidase, partial [Saprospiraceae bacterium]|nr:prolyl oligopeptidase family serine peptidase [Saprospiraceae bacterium]
MYHTKFFLPLCAVLLCAAPLFSQNNAYKRPPADVAAIVEAPPTPNVSISPNRDAMMLLQYNPNPGIATLAQPFLKLAGLRVNPKINSRQRITEFVGVSVQWILEGNKSVNIQLPASGRLAGLPQWSPDSRRLAFAVDMPDHVQLWVADTRTGKASRLGQFAINDVLGSAFMWLEDGERLLVRTIPEGRGPAPDANPVPTGPAIEETAGKKSQVMTLQDLLKNENDENLFEYYGSSQLALVNASTGKAQLLGTPALYASLSWSPDEQYLMVTALRRPFSYRVAFSNFSRKTDIWDKAGKPVRTVAEFPVTDEIPRQGVVTGPREFEWQPLYGARLIWAEALDGGDPKRKADFRDKLMVLEAPFAGPAREMHRTQHRYAGFEWLAAKDQALLTEYDRDRRWATVYRMDLNMPSERDTMFDLSVNDDYNSPGSPVMDRLPSGDYVIAQDGDWLYYDNPGASEAGEFPHLDRINLKTKEKEVLHRCPDKAYEEFIAFAGKGRERIITRYQSKAEVPNFFLSSLSAGRTASVSERKPLTAFQDPAPQLTSVNKQLVKYKRPDGVPLSGTLYLPAGYQPGQRLPLFIWAYPLEYSDASTAGQVRGSDNTFTYYRNDSPLFMVTQGYAVLMDATIPIVGDPETMNNTFIEQATSSGRAAIDYLDSLGIIDRKRVGVGGHSYGAFMTANLLAHSDDYAYGIARSGAYNRTLTPFGFQSERRSFWEAKDIYMNVSPFTYAHKINEPILLIHGEADNNPGTHTIQSERLFQAIKGNGGTARLVLLPHESHGYRARESVLHVLAEMFDWAGKYGKS